MVKLSDYVMNFLVEKGIKDVFLVSGGASMHLLDSLGNNPNLNYYCNHHEQASAMSAEGYARISDNFGVCLVSSGPAQTNALTGLMCAWEDSIPVMFISGNCGSKWLKGDTGLRQRGVHEVDILPMVKDVTKYAVRVANPNMIKYILEEAYYEMMNRRKGPVWIDIPVDIQAAMLDEKMLSSFGSLVETTSSFQWTFDYVANMIKEAKRPVVIIGGGTISELSNIINWTTLRNIPVVCTKNAYGYINNCTMNYVGMIGINGSRQANLAIQNADLILVLGSRLSIPSIGYETEHFAKDAAKIVIDIDFRQILHPNVKQDIGIRMSVSNFMSELYKMEIISKDVDWLQKVLCDYALDYPFRSENKLYVDAYNFYDRLSHFQDRFDILVADQGAAFYAWSQSFQVDNTISFTNGGFSPMGYGLPAAIGACIANDKRPTVCVIGDGGFEMNIQELQTIAHYKLPIKIFVFSNNGYGSIRNTQNVNFGSKYVGSDPKSGVSCVNAEDVGEAYGIRTGYIGCDEELSWIENALAKKGPIIINVQIDPNQKIEPKVVAIKNEDGTLEPGHLENMTPLLSKERLEELMTSEFTED
jgi:acetolactate synthase-1/2/3 large subunit